MPRCPAGQSWMSFPMAAKRPIGNPGGHGASSLDSRSDLRSAGNDKDAKPSPELRTHFIRRHRASGRTPVELIPANTQRDVVWKLVDKDRHTLFDQPFKLGLPLALYALGVGMALTGSSNFWPGMCLAALGACLFAMHLWQISKLNPLDRRLFSLIASCLLFLILGWMIFRPAPLIFEISDKPGGYIQGSKAYGIIWNDSYSEGRIIISNQSAYDYSNIDLTIRSDLSIAAISISGDFLSCNWGVEGLPDFYVRVIDNKGEGNLKPDTVPNVQPIAPNRRVRCDKIPSHGDLTIELALLSLNSVINGQWPKQLTSSRRDPRWISLQGSYEAFGRSQLLFEPKCFTSLCNDIPTNY
jgi:hypothetical protein